MNPIIEIAAVRIMPFWQILRSALFSNVQRVRLPLAVRLRPIPLCPDQAFESSLVLFEDFSQCLMNIERGNKDIPSMAGFFHLLRLDYSKNKSDC